MKSPGSTGSPLEIRTGLNVAGADGTLHGAVECVDMQRNTDGEGSQLGHIDAETRKRGERTGLDTPVVHAVNYAD